MPININQMAGRVVQFMMAGRFTRIEGEFQGWLRIVTSEKNQEADSGDLKPPHG